MYRNIQNIYINPKWPIWTQIFTELFTELVLQKTVLAQNHRMVGAHISMITFWHLTLILPTPIRMLRAKGTSSPSRPGPSTTKESSCRWRIKFWLYISGRSRYSRWNIVMAHTATNCYPCHIWFHIWCYIWCYIWCICLSWCTFPLFSGQPEYHVNHGLVLSVPTIGLLILLNSPWS